MKRVWFVNNWILSMNSFKCLSRESSKIHRQLSYRLRLLIPQEKLRLLLVMSWSLNRSTCLNPLIGKRMVLPLQWCRMKPDSETWHTLLPFMLTSLRQSTEMDRTLRKLLIKRHSLARFQSCYDRRTVFCQDWRTEIWLNWMSVLLILEDTLLSMALRRYWLLRRRWQPILFMSFPWKTQSMPTKLSVDHVLNTLLDPRVLFGLTCCQEEVTGRRRHPLDRESLQSFLTSSKRFQLWLSSELLDLSPTEISLNTLSMTLKIQRWWKLWNLPSTKHLLFRSKMLLWISLESEEPDLESRKKKE